MSGRLVEGAALVTGGGSGLGRSIALALAKEGTPVAVVDLLPDGARETVAAVETAGAKALQLEADVARWADVERVFAAATSRLGPLGIVVNAAGILDGYQPADEMTPVVWERVVSINLTGTFFCAKRALSEMLPRRWGRIINIASVAGLVGAGGGPAYVASKHGVVGLTRQMAVAYAEAGVTINAICPGPIATGLRPHSAQILGADAPPMRGIGGDDAAVKAVTPAGRRGTVDEIAAAARYLASEDAAYITGHTLVVDGGWTAR
jgi:NAD(P)-dependent dehydrogenase (short-subunit alcohol dehydrogenase family)